MSGIATDDGPQNKTELLKLTLSLTYEDSVIFYIVIIPTNLSPIGQGTSGNRYDLENI